MLSHDSISAEFSLSFDLHISCSFMANMHSEMADAYPSASVVGTDLSPIQPMFVPPNCAFEIEDLNLSVR